MNRNQLENIYLANGLTDYRLHTLDDLIKCFGIDARKVAGYENLTEENKQYWETFIIKFFNGWGMDSKLWINPAGIHYVKFVDEVAKDPDYEEDNHVVSVKVGWYEITKDGVVNPYIVKTDKKYKNLPIIHRYVEEYLRFDYLEGPKQKREWLHVTKEGREWY